MLCGTAADVMYFVEVIKGYMYDVDGIVTDGVGRCDVTSKCDNWVILREFPSCEPGCCAVLQETSSIL